MKIRRAVLAVAALVLASCGVIIPSALPTLHLYPVRGPLADQKMVAMIEGPDTAVNFKNRVSIAFPDGETFTGELVRVPGGSSGPGDLAADWDGLFGPGYYLAYVLGAQTFESATLTGSKGNTLQVELLQEMRRYPDQGVARDSRGNVFRITL